MNTAPTDRSSCFRIFEHSLTGPLLIFIVALTIRLIVFLQFRELNPLFAHPVIDAWRYDDLAREFLRLGSWPEPGAFFQPPAYPFFLALLYKITGGSYAWAKFIQICLGSFSCVLVSLIGRRLHSGRIGMTAGLITALYGPLIFFELDLLAPVLIVFWSMLGLWLLTAGLQTHNRCFAFAAGICLGISLIAWPIVGLSCAAIICATGMVMRRNRNRAATAVLLFTGGVILPVIPVFSHNVLHGEPVPVSTNGGINFYLGNNPGWLETISLRPGYPWELVTTLPYREYGPEAVSRQGSSALFFRESVRYFRSRPGEFLGHLAMKTYHLFFGYEIMRNTDIYFFKSYSSLLDRLVFSLTWLKFPFGVLLPLSLTGMMLARRDFRQEHLLSAAYLAGAALGLILFFVTARYRVILAPVLAIYGGLGIWGIFDLLARKNRLLWPMLVLLLVSFAAGNFDLLDQQRHFTGPVYRGQAPFTVGRVMLEENRPRQAMKWLEKSVAIDPGYPDAWVDIGRAAHALGNREKAIAAMHQAAAAAPDYPLPWFNLGLLHDQPSSPASQAAFYYRKFLETSHSYFEARLRGDERIRFAGERLTDLTAGEGEP